MLESYLGSIERHTGDGWFTTVRRDRSPRRPGGWEVVAFADERAAAFALRYQAAADRLLARGDDPTVENLGAEMTLDDEGAPDAAAKEAIERRLIRARAKGLIPGR